MSLGENQNKIQYTVTTSDATFEFPYKYWASDQIIVTKLASGIESSPTFTLSPTNGDTKNGAIVTLTTAVTYCTITIERIVANASDADYQRGALDPVGLTEQFDKGAAMAQQLDEKISRAITVPTTDPSGLTYEIGTVTARASKVLGFDASGNVSNISLATSGTIGVDTDKGLSITENTIEVVPDGTSIGFTGGGAVEVKDDGITTAKILDANVTTAKILDANVTTAKILDANVTKAKIENLTDYTLLGNVSGGAAAPAEVAIIDDDTMATAAATNIPTAKSIKAYTDAAVATAWMVDNTAALPVFTGSMPTEFTDLDLSGTLGANRCFVHLSVESDAAAHIYFRTNGETKDLAADDRGTGQGTSGGGDELMNRIFYISLLTDAAGIIEWKTNAAGSGASVVKLLAYQVLK